MFGGAVDDPARTGPIPNNSKQMIDSDKIGFFTGNSLLMKHIPMRKQAKYSLSRVCSYNIGSQSALASFQSPLSKRQLVTKS